MEQKSNGALIGTAIIILILIIGGIYLWKTQEQKVPVVPSPNIQDVSEVIDTTSNIENDLNEINLDNLDQNI